MEYLVLAFCLGLSAALIGKLKGGSFLVWLAIGFVAPGIGTLAALLWRWERREGRRRCPDCGRVVPLHDQVCMRCGCDLDWPDAARATGA